ncbi:MAG TPA: PEP-utilizing enzyme [Candidatus Limnocylindrales bacterium]|nr:PEP-utilizing enzyme [Candidatus Limnocylindrales bacterium]
MIPQTVRHSIPTFEREWRDELLPRHRAAVADAEDRIDSLPIVKLPALIDELAELAGIYFASIAALAGSAYKMEINLALFYRRHLARSLGGSHLDLLGGLEAPADLSAHAVATLDWSQASVAPSAPAATTAMRPAIDHGRLINARQAAETAAFEALEGNPRRLQAFRRLLAETQHVVLVREEQVRDLTIGWPVMRRAVIRIGEALAARGVIAQRDDVFFLIRAEAIGAVEAIGDGLQPLTVDVARRRSTRDDQATLVPPLVVGRMSRVAQAFWDNLPRMVGAVRSEQALVSGAPASPGRASGPVRVIRGPHEFDALQLGEILVAPLTAPAWTPLFNRAAAVVTDVGSAASHASIIAREYGIPAVVGCGDATSRLRTGMRVTVDGSRGTVEPG